MDGRTDQYALACMTYQLLAGVVPFGRDQGMAVLFAHLSEPPPSLGTRRSDLPRAVDQVLARALAKAPEKRYGCCRDFADALREALGITPRIPAVAAPAAGPPPPRAASLLPEFPGLAVAGTGKEGVSADLAAAATLDSVSLVLPAPPGGAATGKPPAPPRQTASPWHGLGAPLGGEARGYSGDHRYVGQDGAGELGPPGPAPVSRRRGGPTSRAPRARRRFSRFGWLVAALVLLVGGGFAGYEYLYQRHVDTPVSLPTVTNTPRSPGFDKALGKWQHIESRSMDPQPLTIAGLYPPQFSLNGQTYVRTAASATKTCSLAVFGADLQAALQSGRCSQVVRASYLSGDGTMMGTVGVVNLISSNAAQKAGQATGPQEIIAPLTGKEGPTKKLGTGTGVVQAEIKGHYLILMWAEFTNLRSPSGQAQRQALEQFAANLVTGSTNINLSTRMVPGCAGICRTTAVRTLIIIASAKLATPSAIASGSS